MSEIAKLLRLIAPADKEIATQQFNVAAQISGELFVSALDSDYSRQMIAVYNNTHSSSGEVYIGEVGVTPATGMILEKAKWIELPIGSALDLYFVADSAGAEVRVVELS
jgi:hypothetical protein